MLIVLTTEQIEAAYPFMFANAKNLVSYVLVQLLAHLNYHLGQVNYARRGLECEGRDLLNTIGRSVATDRAGCLFWQTMGGREPLLQIRIGLAELSDDK